MQEWENFSVTFPLNSQNEYIIKAVVFKQSGSECEVYTENTLTVNTQLKIEKQIQGPLSVCNASTIDYYLPFWDNDSGDCYFNNYGVEWVLPSGWTKVSQSINYSLERFEVRVLAPSSGSSQSNILKVRGTGHPAGSTPYSWITIVLGPPSNNFDLNLIKGGFDTELCRNELNEIYATYNGVNSTVDGFSWTLSQPSALFGYRDSSIHEDAYLQLYPAGIYTNIDVTARAYNSCGNGPSKSINYSVEDCGFMFSLSPNPTNDNIYLIDENKQVKDNISLKYIILNENGDKVVTNESKFINHKLKVKLNNLESGVYYLKMNVNEHIETKRFIIE